MKLGRGYLFHDILKLNQSKYLSEQWITSNIQVRTRSFKSERNYFCEACYQLLTLIHDLYVSWQHCVLLQANVLPLGTGQCEITSHIAETKRISQLSRTVVKHGTHRNYEALSFIKLMNISDEIDKKLAIIV